MPEIWASWGELDAEEGDNSRTDQNQPGVGVGTGQDSAKPSYRTRFRGLNLRIITYPREKRSFLVFLADQKFLRWLFESFYSVLGSRQVSAGAYDLLPITTVE